MMSGSAVATLLANERIAVREQRNTHRDKIHTERRAGLSAVPSSKQIDDFDKDELTKICAGLRCGRSGNVSVTQLRTLKQLLLHSQGITLFMKDNGALHGLVGELSGKHPIQQLEAAYICVNLGLGDEAECLPVCRAAGPYLIQFLGTSYHLQEASAWAIGNLAGASNKCAAVLSAQGAVVKLIQLLSGSQKGLSVAAAYALTHIIHSKALLQVDELLEIARISSSLLSNEPDFCVLLYLLSSFPACEQTLLSLGVMTRAIAILAGLFNTMETSLKAFTALLRTIGNLSAGVGAFELINHPESSQLLKALLSAPYEHICKETAWVCANLMCHGNTEVRTFAEQAGLLQALENFTNKNSPPFQPNSS